MIRPRTTIAALALGALLAGPAALTAGLTAAPAGAQAAEEEKAPDELAREGMGKIISALELLIATIPTYELPEVLPNGDIIIRRRTSDGGGEPAPRSEEEDGDKPKPI